jgi:hypothetical protein
MSHFIPTGNLEVFRAPAHRAGRDEGALSYDEAL